MLQCYIFSPLPYAAIKSHTQITKFMGPTWDPPGSCRPPCWPMNLAIRVAKFMLDWMQWQEHENCPCYLIKIAWHLLVCYFRQHDFLMGQEHMLVLIGVNCWQGLMGFGYIAWNFSTDMFEILPYKAVKINFQIFINSASVAATSHFTLKRLLFWSYIKDRNGPFMSVNILNAISQGKTYLESKHYTYITSTYW